MYIFLSRLAVEVVVYYIVCDSSFFLLCSFLSFFQVVVHYARDCSCTCVHVLYMYMYVCA